MEDVRVRPIRNGFIVSHYMRPKASKQLPSPPGDYHEEFYPTHVSAAARLAQLAKQAKDSLPSGSPPSSPPHSP